MNAPSRIPRWGIMLPLTALLITSAVGESKRFQYQVGPNVDITIINPFGQVTVHPSKGSVVVVSATPASDQVEISNQRTGNRIEFRSLARPNAGQQQASVTYNIEAPPDAMLNIRSATGPVLVTDLHGELTVDSDAGPVTLQGCDNSHTRVRTIGASVEISNIRGGHLDVSSVNGEVSLKNVSGSNVSVSTTSAPVKYEGGFQIAGEYGISTHSGNIEVRLPGSASVDVTAHSVKGGVQDKYGFQPPQHPPAAVASGQSFSGTANSGAAALRLRSFSGTIVVEKE